MAPVHIEITSSGGAVFILLCTFVYTFGLPESLDRCEEQVSMKELLSAGIILARRGGDRLREIRQGNSVGERVKGETLQGVIDMLIQADMESYRTIKFGLNKAFPGVMVVSEEHKTQPFDFNRIPEIDKHLREVEQIVKTDQFIPLNQLLVWIDPLDATQEYTEAFHNVYGVDLLPFVTTMVCVAVNGQPTIGIIHKPFVNNDQGETTWAWVGYGNSSNLKKTVELVRKDTDPHKIIVSRSHAGTVLQVANKAFNNNVKVTPAGGTGYKMLEVIKGNQNAYIHSTLIKKWDICAGNAILNAIGGNLTTLEGNFIDYGSKHQNRNDKGLLATVYNHQEYLDKLKSLYTKS